MTRRLRPSVWIGAAIIASLAAFVALRMEVTTDVLVFMPQGEGREMAAISRQIAESDLSRTMVLTVEAPTTGMAVAAARALEEALKSDPRSEHRIAHIAGGPPDGVEQAVWELYHSRRFSFVADDAEGASAAATTESLAASARDLLRRLEQPTSTLISRVAPSDPLLILPAFFDRLQSQQVEGIRVHDGRFVTDDLRFAVLFLGTVDSAFDADEQEPVLAAIDEHFARINSEYSGALDLDQSGVNRFSVRAARAIKADIQRVSIVSIVGIALVLWLLFRSAAFVGVASLPIGAGVLAGCAVTLVVYGRVHGVTLAFGASLIGVSIDYILHLYSHHVVAPHPRGPFETVKSLRGSLVTGAGTTIIGFSALGASSFQGLREVALFSAVGVAAALAATLWIVPGLITGVRIEVPFRARVLVTLTGVLNALRSHRQRLWLLPLAALVAGGVGVTTVRWSDDLANLGSLDPELLAEDERVRARVTRFEQQRFIVAIGDTEEEALRVNDRVADALEEGRVAGELTGFRNIGTWLRSADRQTSVARAFVETPGLWERARTEFEAVGFRSEALAPFRDALTAPLPPPLTYRDLVESPLAPIVRSSRVQLGERVAFVSFLHEIHDLAALQARLDGVDGALVLDQASLMSEASRAYQRRTAELMLFGLLAVLIALSLRYRDARAVAASFLPALLAAGVTVAVVSAIGLPLDLVALTALLMVVSIGVDLGVFLVDAERGHSEELPAALLSVGAASCTTIMGFSLLALSDFPVLFTIGVTAGVGVFACLLLAPTALVLLGDRERWR